MNNFYLEGRTREGATRGFNGSLGSGLAHLNVDGIHIPCDDATTVESDIVASVTSLFMAINMMRMQSSVRRSDTKLMRWEC